MNCVQYDDRVNWGRAGCSNGAHLNWTLTGSPKSPNAVLLQTTKLQKLIHITYRKVCTKKHATCAYLQPMLHEDGNITKLDHINSKVYNKSSVFFWHKVIMIDYIARSAYNLVVPRIHLNHFDHSFFYADINLLTSPCLLLILHQVYILCILLRSKFYQAALPHCLVDVWPPLKHLQKG